MDKINLDKLKNENKSRLENINLDKNEEVDIFENNDIFEELTKNFNKLSKDMEQEKKEDKENKSSKINELNFDLFDELESSVQTQVKNKASNQEEVNLEEIGFEEEILESKEKVSVKNESNSKENLKSNTDVNFKKSVLTVEEQSVYQIKKEEFFTNGNSILTFAFEDEDLTQYFDLGFKNESINKGFGDFNKINTLGKEKYLNLYIIGLGKRVDFDDVQITQLVSSFIPKLDENVNIDLITIQWANKEKVAKIICEKHLENSYQITKVTKQNAKTKKIVKICLATDIDLQNILDNSIIMSMSQNLAKDLLYLPGNVLTPEVFVDFIEKTTKKLNNVSIDIKETKQLFDEGFGLITSVNQGSDKNAYLVTLEYKNNKENNFKTIIGKGITFDSGGYSLKPVMGMHDMHSDMGGAAISLATFIAIAKLNANVNLRCIIPITENLVNGRAYKVEDVIVSKSGKTVQIISTDAEGRLVLADSVTHAQSFKTDEIISVATLTASNFLTDYEITPIFSNSESLTYSLLNSGVNEQDYLWPMPLDHYNNVLTKKVENSSVIADVANKSSKAGSPMLYGANFIYSFVENKKEISFAHLDIGGQIKTNNVFNTPTLKLLINHYLNNDSNS